MNKKPKTLLGKLLFTTAGMLSLLETQLGGNNRAVWMALVKANKLQSNLRYARMSTVEEKNLKKFNWAADFLISYRKISSYLPVKRGVANNGWILWTEIEMKVSHSPLKQV